MEKSPKSIMKKTHNNMYSYENHYYDNGYKHIAGIDEAGRGS
jgi:hypothetical protein